MGGSINVAVRLKSGESFCQERWTNSTTWWFRNPLWFQGDETLIRDYLDQDNDADYILDPRAYGLPKPVENGSYGLIVFDFLSGTILDNNSYTTLNYFHAIYTGGKRRHENFEACARAGILSMERSEWDSGTIVRTANLSEEDALLLGEEAYQNEMSDTPKYNTRFIIDTSPMKYFGFPELSEDYVDKLHEIGFPLTLADGLNATMRPIPEAREISHQERIARELYSFWKDGEQGKPYRGVRFEDVDSYIRNQFLEKANHTDETTLRNFRIAGLLSHL